MSTINDGGPAFPQFASKADNPEGMTLRDYFAAKALCGLLAGEPPEAPGTAPDEWAKQAYRIADSMISEREKGGGN
jgi:hypothetical protein